MNNTNNHVKIKTNLSEHEQNRLAGLSQNIDKFGLEQSQLEYHHYINKSDDPLKQATNLYTGGIFKRIAQNVANKYHVQSWIKEIEVICYESYYFMKIQNKYDIKTIFACCRSNCTNFVITEIFNTTRHSMAKHGLPDLDFINIDDLNNKAEFIIESRLPDILDVCNNSTEKTI